MTGWALVWKVIFFASLTVFMAMAVVVTIGGFRDLLCLFRFVDKDAKEEETE